MIFIIAIVGPFSGLKEQVDQNELGKEQQPRRLVLDGSYGIEFPDSHPPRCGCQAATVLALAETPWRAKANSLGSRHPDMLPLAWVRYNSKEDVIARTLPVCP
jgi:hypothetical protein